MAAARRKRKRCGGMAILGYDVDPQNGKLVVNEEEAALVRAIYGLYLRHQTLALVVRELSRRGWVNKRWVTRKGRQRGGRPFTNIHLAQAAHQCDLRRQGVLQARAACRRASRGRG